MERAHMTGGAMDPLPAAAVAAAADEEADEEADPLAAGKAATWAAAPVTPGPLAHFLPPAPRRVPFPTPRSACGSVGRGLGLLLRVGGPRTCPGVRLAASSCPRLPGMVQTPQVRGPLGASRFLRCLPVLLRGAHPLDLRGFGQVVWPLRTFVFSSVKWTYCL